MAAMRHAPVAIFALIAVFAAAHARAESSKGENYSAGKTAPQLFNSDCTGSGCHAGTQGLARGKSAKELTEYLREHYTNSKESAALLSGYLRGVPGANAARPPVRPGEQREQTSRGAPAEEPKSDAKTDDGPSWPRLPSLSLPSFLTPSPSEPETVKREETTPPPTARTRQSTRAPVREERSEPKPQEEKQESGGPSWLPSLPSFLTPKSEEAATPPVQEEKPAPRKRTATRPPARGERSDSKKEEPKQESSSPSWLPSLPSFLTPKPEEAATPPAREEKPAPRKRTAARPPKIEAPKTEEAKPPKAEQAAKPSNDDVKPAPRPQQNARPPKTEAPKTEVPKTEQAAKPPAVDDTKSIPRTRQSSRPPKAAEDGGKPQRETRAPARLRQQVPAGVPAITDPNNPSPDEMYRPARPRSETDQPMAQDGDQSPATTSSVTPAAGRPRVPARQPAADSQAPSPAVPVPPPPKPSIYD